VHNNYTQVISTVQQKGGAGKSTLIMLIASLMVADGAKIAIIDTDPQKHIFEWAEKGNIDLDWHYVENDEELIPTINALKSTGNYDVIFVDTAGFKSAMSIYAINAANLVLIPTKATEADAKGALKTYSHVKSVGMSMGKEIAAYGVLMDIDANTNITESIIEALDDNGLPRIRASCMHRTGFKEMSSTGMGPKGSAKTTAQSLLAEFQLSKLLDFYIR
jgi:chromosome partitioning protein